MINRRPSASLKKTFLVSVEASLGPNAKVAIESPSKIVGYYQQLGITVRNEAELISLARSFIEKDSGAKFVKIEELWVPDFDGADAEIKELCGNLDEVGVWYYSGHAFFDDSKEESEG